MSRGRLQSRALTGLGGGAEALRWEDIGAVFHSPRGNPLVQGSHHYSWRAVRAAAGLPGIRWHDLRHFCATQLLELGLDHFAVSVQLGHEDRGALVMARYGHPPKDAARARLDVFELDEDRAGQLDG